MRLFQPLFALIASATDHQLALYIDYLKTENRILRDKLPKRITITPRERQRLLRFGKPLGSAIKELITIVSPKTFLRWVNQDTKPRSQAPSPREPGRPPTPTEVRELILRIARETGWGYSRIHGELKKLGLAVSRSAVVNVLKAEGLDPGPKRGEGTWREFIRRHRETLWACDFFTQNVWTVRGLVPVYVLLFIHIGTRKVHITGMTANPDDAWVRQQARNFAIHLGDAWTPPAEYLILDNDSKFTAGFEAVLESEGIEPVRTCVRAPNMNSHCERAIGSIKRESLDHFVVFGEAHLRHILAEYIRHYETDRPHQGLGNVPLPVANGEQTRCGAVSGRRGRLPRATRRALAALHPSSRVSRFLTAPSFQRTRPGDVPRGPRFPTPFSPSGPQF